MEQHSVHKAIIRDFYRRVMGQGDIAYAEEIIADDYIQHSSLGKPGKAGLLEALDTFRRMPKPATTVKPFMRLIAENEYVVTNMGFGWDGAQKVVVDLFRFRNGQIVEHWDVVQDQPRHSSNGHVMMNGATEADTTAPLELNKAIVHAYYQRVWIDQQTGCLDKYIAADLVQHHPGIANGLAGLHAFLNRKSVSIKQIHRIIGEGNFVVVQAEGTVDKQPTVFYDTFRLDAEKIVEQWSVSQSIPGRMPHENGMI